MGQKSKCIEGLPLSLIKDLKKLGENIKIARRKRNLSLDDMAARMSVNRKTLTRLEKGDPSIGFAVVASALFILGLDKNIEKLADPNEDKVGNVIIYEKFNKKRKKNKPPEIDMNF